MDLGKKDKTIRLCNERDLYELEERDCGNLIKAIWIMNDSNIC